MARNPKKVESTAKATPITTKTLKARALCQMGIYHQALTTRLDLSIGRDKKLKKAAMLYKLAELPASPQFSPKTHGYIMGANKPVNKKQGAPITSSNLKLDFHKPRNGCCFANIADAF